MSMGLSIQASEMLGSARRNSWGAALARSSHAPEIGFQPGPIAADLVDLLFCLGATLIMVRAADEMRGPRVLDVS
jgi:hypothetical protein